MTDAAGRLWVHHPATDPTVLGSSFAAREWYRGASKAQDTYLSGAYERAAKPVRLVYAFAIPLFDPERRRTGYLVVQDSGVRLRQSLKNLALPPGGSAALIDHNGRVVFEIGPARFPPAEDLRTRSPCIDAALRGQEKTDTAKFTAGNYIVVCTPARQAGWAVVTYFPTSQLLAPVRAIAWQISIVGVLLLILTGVLAARWAATYARNRQLLADGERLTRELNAQLDERQREEERFRTVVEAAPNGIVMVNEAGIITLVNAQMEKLFGYGREELIGRSVEVLVPERFRASHPGQRAGFVSDPHARAMGAGHDLFGRRKDGCEFPVEIGLNPIATREGPVVLASVIDITERKSAEEQLMRLQRERERILNSVDFGIHALDRDGKIVFENLRAAKMFDRDAQEMIGQPAHALMHHTRADGSPHPQSECPIYATLHDGISRRVEDDVFWRKDGGSFPVAYTATPEFDEAGNVTGVLVSFRDISARKRAEEALRKLNEELRIATEQAQAADRIKSAFLATMSHELRTPLNSIIGFTGIILQELAGPLNPEQQKQLEMVRGSARHLLALINDVLDISKIEAGQLEVAHESFDLRASIGKVVGIVKPLAEQKGLALRVEGVEGAGDMVGDARRVEQILLNLLSNAVKFTEAGTVTLAVEPVAEYVGSAGAAPGPAVRLRVTDTGMGIKPEDLTTLFQPFRQLDSGLARNHEGTGLGLAICRRLADLMGGEIRAESRWGNGSSFSVTLPLAGAPT